MNQEMRSVVLILGVSYVLLTALCVLDLPVRFLEGEEHLICNATYVLMLLCYQGAYTARMIAYVIVSELGGVGFNLRTVVLNWRQGYIGVLDRTEMDHFASIFMNLQKRGKEKDPERERRCSWLSFSVRLLILPSL